MTVIYGTAIIYGHSISSHIRTKRPYMIVIWLITFVIIESYMTISMYTVCSYMTIVMIIYDTVVKIIYEFRENHIRTIIYDPIWWLSYTNKCIVNTHNHIWFTIIWNNHIRFDHIWELFISDIYGDHIWPSYMSIICDYHAWSLYMLIMLVICTQSYTVVIRNSHIW